MKFFPTQHIVRKIATNDRQIFLTFDDGPCDFTLVILDLLKKYQVQATFFVIGKKADTKPEIIQRLLNEGHRILSHSIDHDYSNYFKSDTSVLKWITQSLQHLNQVTGQTSRVFRPPAGIITPPVARSSVEASIQLILWNQRFYDSVQTLTLKKIDSYVAKASAGDIVLLHDDQKEKNKDQFLKSLEFLIQRLLEKKYQLLPLPF